jgi:hypothetical protein
VELVRAPRTIDTLTARIIVFSGRIGSADEVRALAAPGVANDVDEYTATPHIVDARVLTGA